MDNLYNILNVNKNCLKNDIKKAYNKLAVIWHPDKNKSEEAKEKYQKIRLAYDILIDDKKRAYYDETGEIEQKNREMDQNEFFSKFGGIPGFSNMFGNFGEFNNVLQLDIVHIITVKINDIYNGYKNKIQYKKILYSGNTREIQIKTIDIDLPIGFNPRDKILIKKGGNEIKNINVNKVGNLIIEIRLQKPTNFNINQQTMELHSTQKITLEQSLCGISMSIKLPNNEVIKYHYSNIIQPNKFYEIKNKGIPYIDKSNKLTYHSLFINFDIIYPTVFTENILKKTREIFNIDYQLNKLNNSNELIITSNNSETKNNEDEDDEDPRNPTMPQKIECNQQ